MPHNGRAMSNILSDTPTFEVLNPPSPMGLTIKHLLS